MYVSHVNICQKEKTKICEHFLDRFFDFFLSEQGWIKNLIKIIKEMIRLADKDGSGALDFPEFLNMMKERVSIFFCKLYVLRTI